LDLTERIQFTVAATVYRCLHNMEPRYQVLKCATVCPLLARKYVIRVLFGQPPLVTYSFHETDLRRIAIVHLASPSQSAGTALRLTRLPQVTGSVI